MGARPEPKRTTILREVRVQAGWRNEDLSQDERAGGTVSDQANARKRLSEGFPIGTHVLGASLFGDQIILDSIPNRTVCEDDSNGPCDTNVDELQKL